ncbi:hypothetical protein N7462_004163 [Penicillium macrosclerotiorum]|uniref:uncharacterized protein n=1 Tax=Penicillium macrosclerotiorum TaxID=303699 RepID=UPI0025473CBB|nr:uncharacterized protein N7462_004163 [Penicillium macrosclerotiorum]KAJ5689771.1 hypothetical protein N7462_004163 [Penicillium macrosclerotiorum]
MSKVPESAAIADHHLSILWVLITPWIRRTRAERGIGIDKQLCGLLDSESYESTNNIRSSS